jgi:hypothetical protein
LNGLCCLERAAAGIGLGAVSCHSSSGISIRGWGPKKGSLELDAAEKIGETASEPNPQMMFQDQGLTLLN